MFTLHISTRQRAVMPATVSDRRSLPAAWSQSSAHPMQMMMKLRNASALTSTPRISERLARMPDSSLAGIICWSTAFCSICASCAGTKPEPRLPGATVSSRATPAVSARLMPNAFLFAFHIPGSSNTRFKAKIASRGMVNSAMTRMDDTARNLLYIGT